MNIKNVYNKISDPKILLQEKEKIGDKMLGRKSIFVLALCSEKADHGQK
jgi:hypothetical protein